MWKWTTKISSKYGYSRLTIKKKVVDEIKSMKLEMKYTKKLD